MHPIAGRRRRSWCPNRPYSRILISNGIPGDRNMVSLGQSDRSVKKDGGDEEESWQKRIHYRKHRAMEIISNVYARSFYIRLKLENRWNSGPRRQSRAGIGLSRRPGRGGSCRYNRSLWERVVRSGLDPRRLRVFQIINLDKRDPRVIASAANNRGIISRRQSRDDGCFAIIGGR